MDSRQEQEQRESELGTEAAHATHKPNLSQPVKLNPDPSIGSETEYAGKPQPQAPLEPWASELKGQWASECSHDCLMASTGCVVVVPTLDPSQLLSGRGGGLHPIATNAD